MVQGNVHWADALRGAAGSLPDWEGTRHTHDNTVLYIGVNPHHYTVTLTLPEPPQGGTWKRIVDTSFPAPEDFLLQPEAGLSMQGLHYDIPAKAAVAFFAKGVKVEPPPAAKPQAAKAGASASVLPRPKTVTPPGS